MISRLALGILALSFISFAAVAGKADTASMKDSTTNRIYGKVVETMDANNYTYVLIDDGEKKHWAAGPKSTLNKGDMIGIDSQMPFTNFESKGLGKTFETIYFVNRFISDKPVQNAPVGNPHAGLNKEAASSISMKGIKKAKGGKTVAEVFAEKQTLAGKSVRVRGKVVKYTEQVMGKNWLHIQDSSSDKRLVVTTGQEAKKGDLVVINGVTAVDQDLGYGYVYEVIIEKAKVSVE